jgi:hypothetical protein
VLPISNIVWIYSSPMTPNNPIFGGLACTSTAATHCERRECKARPSSKARAPAPCSTVEKTSKFQGQGIVFKPLVSLDSLYLRPITRRLPSFYIEGGKGKWTTLPYHHRLTGDENGKRVFRLGSRQFVAETTSGRQPLSGYSCVMDSQWDSCSLTQPT